MSDDGYGGGDGGADYDYDGPRCVPLYFPRNTVDTLTSFGDGAFVRATICNSSLRAHNGDRMKAMIS